MEREREREIVRWRAALYAYENIQVSIKAQDLWTLGCRAWNTIFPLKIYVFIHARTARTENAMVGRGRLRAGSLFAFSSLLTSYSRIYFLRQPSCIVNVNSLFLHVAANNGGKPETSLYHGVRKFDATAKSQTRTRSSICIGDFFCSDRFLASYFSLIITCSVQVILST